MRTLLIALTLAAAAALPWRPASAADDVHDGTSPVVLTQSEDVPPEDDNTVAVQLTVLGIVLGAVFVVGTGAYVLRRKLGLTAYTPPADSGHH